MQAAFRAQNPCLFNEDGVFKRKENAYVFDFDPARTLVIFEEFANDLSIYTSAGRGDIEARKENIRELLNFFPVIGEDEEGELVELDAEAVLTIPRKIKSVEVVRRGFMSNFLFQNIGNVFSAPREVMDIIEQFTAVSEPKTNVKLTEEVKKDLSLDENGEVQLSDEYVIGLSKDIFGEKRVAVKEVDDIIETCIDEKIATDNDRNKKMAKVIKDYAKNIIVNAIVEDTKDNYGDTLRKSDEKQLSAKLIADVDRIVEKAVSNYTIEENLIEHDRIEAMQTRNETGRSTDEIEKEFAEKKQEAQEKFKTGLSQVMDQFEDDSRIETTKTIETKVKERERDEIEDGVRDHLRGFSRTIPSFLMAYGDDSVTLATFDNIIPDKVFLEVTSITLEQFRFLRDGGEYIDSETGEKRYFNGHLFDSVVFDDSVKEFLGLKKKLADYFDEKSVEDIFDYIPPQKTNQIYTPKDVVKRMVDMLEEENPGCFDDPDKTFIDLYMKSGLYITEIVKRLYQSEGLKKAYPDKNERLKHIFEKQVYGLAPTEIIYKIATSFILGFDEDVEITKHNFKQVDALPFAKEGTLQNKIDELYDN